MTAPARRRWSYPAAAGAALVAAFAVALFAVRPLPELVLGVVGIDDAFDLRGGVIVRYRLAPGTPPDAVAAIRDGLGGAASIDSDVVTIGYVGAEADQVDALVAMIARPLRFQVVDNDAPYSRRLYQIAESDPAAAARGVKAEVDSWTPEAGGDLTDFYLWATDAKAIEAYVAEVAEVHGLRVPDDRELGFEHVETGREVDVDRPRSFWRTYLLDRTVALDGRHVARAEVSNDPNIGVPVVLLDFTREGAARFGELTAANVGKKIATLVGDEVVSAPIINGAIRGGRASITMGGTNADDQEREAQALAANLQVGPLPPGEVLDAGYRAPTVTAGTLWLARGLCGFALGALAFVAIALVARHSERRAGFPGTASRPPPVGRLLVTLATAGAVYLTSALLLPGLNDLALEDHGIDPELPQFGLFALGVTPILFAFILVELAALAVPAWRRLRLTPDGRNRLGRVVAVLALALAAVQAWFVTRSFVDFGTFAGFAMGPSIVSAHPLVLVASMVAATAWLAWLAGIASEHGLGNGYSTILAAGALIAIGRELHAVGDAGLGPYVVADTTVTGALVLAALAAAVVGAAIAWIVTRRFVERDGGAAVVAPVAGLVPLSWSAGAIALLSLLVMLTDAIPIEWLAWTVPGQAWHARVVLGSAVVLSLGLGWALSRPAPTAAALARMTGAAGAPARRAFAWALGASLALVLALALLAFALGGHVPPALLDVLGVAVIAVVAVDLVAEWRARRRADLVGVWPIHQVALADVAVDVLAKHGIAAHLRGRHHRALYHVFGPFVPIEVMVPSARAAEATALLRDLFDPAARGSATAW